MSRTGLRIRSRGVARKPGLIWIVARAAVDCLLLGAAHGGIALSSAASDVPLAPVEWIVAYPLLVLALFKVRGLYDRRIRADVLDDLRQIVSLTAVAAMFVFALRALLHDDPFLAAQGVRQWLFAMVCLAAGRVAFSRVLRYVWTRGALVEPTLIVGAGHVGQLVAKRLLQSPQGGVRPIGFLDKEPLNDQAETTSALRVLGASWDLDRVVEEHDVRHVIITFSTAPHHVLLRIVRRCHELSIPISLVPRLYEQMTDWPQVERLGGLPLIVVKRADPKGWQFGVKYTTDRLIAAGGLVVLSPVLALCALAVLVTMRRPVLYRQLRVGRDGHVFEMLKFRSMRPAELSETGNGLESDDRDRLTWVGAILRATSADELPQLVNVVKGDMSLVGPRPEQPEFARIFEQDVHRYDERLRVKSGITGWAQVHGLGRGRDRFGIASLSDRVEWDNYYIENWSLWLDIKILLMTAAAVLRFRQT